MACAIAGPYDKWVSRRLDDRHPSWHPVSDLGEKTIGGLLGVVRCNAPLPLLSQGFTSRHLHQLRRTRWVDDAPQFSHRAPLLTTRYHKCSVMLSNFTSAPPKGGKRESNGCHARHRVQRSESPDARTGRLRSPCCRSATSLSASTECVADVDVSFEVLAAASPPSPLSPRTALARRLRSERPGRSSHPRRRQSSGFA